VAGLDLVLGTLLWSDLSKWQMMSRLDLKRIHQLPLVEFGLFVQTLSQHKAQSTDLF